MSKKVLIISSSFRNKSNSDQLAHSFEKGAIESGNNVEYISLKGKKISFCMGCLACQKLGKCVINDDANEITDKICNADVVVWATPIYYYEMSGQMKTMIDRANSLFERDFKFREVYLLSTAADDDFSTPNRALGGVQGWIDCFEGVKFAGSLFVGGVNNPDDIRNNIGLEKAYEMGKNV